MGSILFRIQVWWVWRIWQTQTQRLRCLQHVVQWVNIQEANIVGWPTESHYFYKIRRAKFNHDGIGVTIDNFSIVGVTVCDVVLWFNFLYVRVFREFKCNTWEWDWPASFSQSFVDRTQSHWRKWEDRAACQLSLRWNHTQNLRWSIHRTHCQVEPVLKV